MEQRIEKALSIRQPWAWLVSNGHKDIENRTWQTHFRGPFLIHAGMKFDKAGYEWVVSNFDIDLPGPDEFDRGGFVGSAEITDCVSRSDSPWFSGPYGFVLTSARPLPFRPSHGKLGFFNVVLEERFFKPVADERFEKPVADERFEKSFLQSLE